MAKKLLHLAGTSTAAHDPVLHDMHACMGTCMCQSNFLPYHQFSFQTAASGDFIVHHNETVGISIRCVFSAELIPLTVKILFPLCLRRQTSVILQFLNVPTNVCVPTREFAIFVHYFWIVAIGQHVPAHSVCTLQHENVASS